MYGRVQRTSSLKLHKLFFSITPPSVLEPCRGMVSVVGSTVGLWSPSRKRFSQKWNLICNLFNTMPMDSWVTFLSPQNTPYSLWGLIKVSGSPAISIWFKKNFIYTFKSVYVTRAFRRLDYTGQTIWSHPLFFYLSLQYRSPSAPVV